MYLIRRLYGSMFAADCRFGVCRVHCSWFRSYGGVADVGLTPPKGPSEESLVYVAQSSRYSLTQINFSLSVP